jgi:hypothetical protein
MILQLWKKKGKSPPILQIRVPPLIAVIMTLHGTTPGEAERLFADALERLQ